MVTREAPASLGPSSSTRGVIHEAGRAGQGVAAALGSRKPGDLRVVDQAGRFPDPDHATALDPGVPFDRRRVPQRHPPQRRGHTPR